MFRRKHGGRRSTNIVFVIFRLVLSAMMFIVLLAGIYSAYKHFSGLDPLKLDPQQVFSNLISSKSPKEFLAVFSSLKLSEKIPNQKIIPDSKQILGENNSKEPTLENRQPLFRFLLVADSHNDNVNLRKALIQSQQKWSEQIKFIIGLGDYTDVGTVDELKVAKVEFDNTGLRYFLTVGDHDLWESRDKSLPPNSNFRQVFGPSFQSFTYDNFRFILLYNSDNYLGLSEEQLGWLSSELEKGKNEQTKAMYVFVHEPLYHPSSDHVMGRVEGKLKEQAKSITKTLKSFEVKKVFAGDIHYFSEYKEPETNLPMVTVGAITTERNAQAPRYAVISVFEDGVTLVEDIEIK